jgi:NADH-quinone oxidoreductase subunit H
VAYATLLERKVMAGIQRRRGPSVVGVFGLGQPFADGLKLFIKEIFTGKSNKYLFLFAPVMFLARIIELVSCTFKLNAVVQMLIRHIICLAVSHYLFMA